MTGRIVPTSVGHGRRPVLGRGPAALEPAERGRERHFRVARALKVRDCAVDILADSGARTGARSWLLRITRRPSIGGAQGRSNGAPFAGAGPTGVSAPGAADGTARLIEQEPTLKRRERLQAEIRDLETISTAIVADLRTRVARNGYHPPLRVVAERLLAELTAELLS